MRYNNSLTHFEEATSGFENAARTFLQVLPGGGIIDRGVFGTYDIIQMKRIEKFMLSMQELINTGDIQHSTLEMLGDYLGNEEGQEYLYLTIDKSKKIRNQKKLESLRNLFINHSSCQKPMDIDNAERYLKVMEDLDIEAILILKFRDSFIDGTLPNKGTLDFGSIENDTANNKKVKYLEAVSQELSIDIEDLNYYHQQLITCGLIIDDGIGRVGATALQMFAITKRGIQFLAFINSPL